MLIISLPYILAVLSTVIFFINLDYISLHIITALLSYALLFASFILSLIVDYQQRQLKKHNFNKFINALPSLQDTEKFLVISIYLGFILLTISMAGGFIKMNDIFAQHLAHKTTFVIISWLLLFIVIMLRLFTGLRDKKVIIAIQASFILIIIGYFGTKIALRILGIL